MCNGIADHPTVEIPHVTIFNTTKSSSHDHDHKPIIITCAIAGLCCALLLTGIAIFLCTRKNKRDDLIPTTWIVSEQKTWNAARVFSYKEIKTATNNFKDVIGSGSLGSMYLGELSDGKLVVVKVRFDRTQFGVDSFIEEVNALSQLRHQNLVQLEGFCSDAKQQILVYEYLPGGLLANILYGIPSSEE